ncbi:hypothetical protein THIX_20552 [Thiomonas sp. X19]|nr:hypothetical protein THIX_20552 [Thiomonas sp. X19]
MGFIAPQSNSGTGAPVKLAPDCSPVPRRTVIHFDGDVARRMGHTIVRDALQELHAADAEMRALAEDDLEVLTGALLAVRKSIREQTRRGMDTDALEILQSMEARHGFTLVTQSDREWRSVADGINSARGKAVDAWMAVLSGEATVEESMPRGDDGLLLQVLTGHSPMQCLEHWARIKGGQRNLKTYEKFRGIAQDLEAILDGQSVEALTPEHVQLYADHLAARGNGLKTVHGKLSICSTLLGHCELPRATRKSLVDVRPPKARVSQHSAPRIAFSSEQLGALLQAIFADSSLPPDDRVIVALQALAGARLEEICSLRGPQLAWNGVHWLIDFVEPDIVRKTSERKAKAVKADQLKCADSIRKVPVQVSAVHGLHERLTALKRAAGQGLLFRHLASNRYGIYGGALSMRLNRRIDAVVGNDRRLVLESLRNTAAPAMRRAGVDADERRMFMGHAPIDVHARHYDLPAAEDLQVASRAVSDMVARALAGRDYPALDTVYRARPHRTARRLVPWGKVSAADRERASSVCQDDGQRDGRLDAPHRGDQDIERHAPISSTDLTATVTGKGIVNILGDASRAANGLESVPKAMEHQAAVLEVAPGSVAHVTPPPLRPSAGALAESVGAQIGEQPLSTEWALAVDVMLKADAKELWMHRNGPNRARVLHSYGGSIGADVEQEPSLGIAFNVSQAQLAQLLEPASCEQTERGQPDASLAAAPSRSKTLGVHGRGENSLQFRSGECPPTDVQSLALRHTQTTDGIGRVQSSINCGLEHGAEVTELVGHRLGVQRAGEQRVAVRSDEAPVELCNGALNEAVESFGAGFELDDGAQWAARIQVSPIFEDGEKGLRVRHGAFGGVGRGAHARLQGRTHIGLFRTVAGQCGVGDTRWMRRGGHWQLQAGETRQPLGGQVHAQHLGGRKVAGAQLHADELTELGLMLARHAHLEEIDAALLREIDHEKGSGTWWTNVAEPL